MQHTFFVHFFAVVSYDCNEKLPETSQLHVLKRKLLSYVLLFTFFHCCSFSPSWPLAFLIFSPPLQNFHVVLPTKNVFFISCLSCLSPFFSLNFVDLSPTFSFSLSFSFSILQICERDNYTKLTTLDNTDTETISAFRFRLY